VIPYLLYEDAGAAIDFLVSTFGFEEHLRLPTQWGGVAHCELRFGQGVVMVAEGEPASSMVIVYVDDVDAHHRATVAAGVRAEAPPEDLVHGERSYAVVDPGGHRWHFHSKPEERRLLATDG
jgi:uncharacterized glyoxalase superfamily protein PhnB